MSSSSPFLLAVGEVLWDLFPDRECLGGAPANFACQAALQGAGVWMMTAVGADRLGTAAREGLARCGVQVELVQTCSAAPTGTVGVELDAGGKPTFTIHENSAWDHLWFTQAADDCLRQVDAVCFGTLGQRAEPARSTIRQVVRRAGERGIPRLLDINLRSPFYDAACLRQSIGLATLLKLSDEELPEVLAACDLTGQAQGEAALPRLRERTGLEMIVMTCGAEGAVLVTPHETVRQPGIPTEVVDTVGAGDAFAAAFLLGLLGGVPKREALRRAVESASATCRHAGAVPPGRQGSSR